MDNKYELSDLNQLYFKDLKKYKPLTKKEEHKLLEQWRLHNDIEARNKLITANLKYACKLAYDYRNRGVSFNELLTEANNGLIEYIDKFDLSQDIKVYSYAKWGIIKHLQKAVDKKNKMPYSDLPSENEMQACLNDDNRVYQKDYSIDYDNPFIEEEYAEEDEISKNTLVDDLLSVLDEREKDILNMKYSRGYDKEYTLEDIGKKYHLTKERVRQIMEKGLVKVRSQALMVENSYVSR